MNTAILIAATVLLVSFGAMTWAAYTLAPLIGYNQFGGREPALLIIRFAVWAALYLGFFGIALSAIAVAFLVPATSDLFLAGKLAGGAGFMLGFALHGPIAKEAK